MKGLKAIRSTGRKENGNYLWTFECTLCGKKIERRSGLVTGGQIISCGCFKARNLVTKPLAEKLGQQYGTNLSRIKSDRLPVNNTSGHKGVSLHRQAGKSDRWTACIYFKGRRYYLGCYENKSQAIAAREEAEKELFGDFILWYNNKENIKEQKKNT